jgi:hypothetical protein
MTTTARSPRARAAARGRGRGRRCSARELVHHHGEALEQRIGHEAQRILRYEEPRADVKVPRRTCHPTSSRAPGPVLRNAARWPAPPRGAAGGARVRRRSAAAPAWSCRCPEGRRSPPRSRATSRRSPAGRRRWAGARGGPSPMGPSSADEDGPALARRPVSRRPATRWPGYPRGSPAGLAEDGVRQSSTRPGRAPRPAPSALRPLAPLQSEAASGPLERLGHQGRSVPTISGPCGTASEGAVELAEGRRNQAGWQVRSTPVAGAADPVTSRASPRPAREAQR